MWHFDQFCPAVLMISLTSPSKHTHTAHLLFMHGHEQNQYCQTLVYSYIGVVVIMISLSLLQHTHTAHLLFVFPQVWQEWSPEGPVPGHGVFLQAGHALQDQGDGGGNLLQDEALLGPQLHKR